jgi:hypothetical protein
MIANRCNTLISAVCSDHNNAYHAQIIVDNPRALEHLSLVGIVPRIISLAKGLQSNTITTTSITSSTANTTASSSAAATQQSGQDSSEVYTYTKTYLYTHT